MTRCRACRRISAPELETLRYDRLPIQQKGSGVMAEAVLGVVCITFLAFLPVAVIGYVLYGKR